MQGFRTTNYKKVHDDQKVLDALLYGTQTRLCTSTRRVHHAKRKTTRQCNTCKRLHGPEAKNDACIQDQAQLLIQDGVCIL